MPDPVTAEPATPHPVPMSASVMPGAEGTRGSSTTASPPNEHVVASSFSTAASAGSSSSHYRPLSPPSLSSMSKAPPSVSDSRTATLTATSPPTTVGARQGSVPPSGPSTASMSLSPNLPSHDSQLHIAEARRALVASMSNMLDNELQSRASLLHSNAAALSRQEQEVARATEALRRENDKLAKVAKDAGRKIKELGNVQNWAELLEMDFLALEETMRLARDGGAHSDCGDCCSQCSGSYWSGSGSEQLGDTEDNGEGDDDDEGGSDIIKSSTSAQRSAKQELERRGGESNGIEDIGKGKGKGKEVDRTTQSDHSIPLVDQATTTSNSSPTGLAPDIHSIASATVSLDEALLESLTDALATDMCIGVVSTEHKKVST
jgi:hypothetical protein